MCHNLSKSVCVFTLCALILCASHNSFHQVAQIVIKVAKGSLNSFLKCCLFSSLLTDLLSPEFCTSWETAWKYIYFFVYLPSPGPHTLNLPNDFRLGSVGKTIWGGQSKIVDPDSEGIGEVLYFISCHMLFLHKCHRFQLLFYFTLPWWFQSHNMKDIIKWSTYNV